MFMRMGLGLAALLLLVWTLALADESAPAQFEAPAVSSGVRVPLRPPWTFDLRQASEFRAQHVPVAPPGAPTVLPLATPSGDPELRISPTVRHMLALHTSTTEVGRDVSVLVRARLDATAEELSREVAQRQGTVLEYYPFAQLAVVKLPLGNVRGLGNSKVVAYLDAIPRIKEDNVTAAALSGIDALSTIYGSQAMESILGSGIREQSLHMSTSTIA